MEKDISRCQALNLFHKSLFYQEYLNGDSTKATPGG